MRREGGMRNKKKFGIRNEKKFGIPHSFSTQENASLCTREAKPVPFLFGNIRHAGRAEIATVPAKNGAILPFGPGKNE